jgi:uncharacterized membrane protein YbhN (UPF0104 family)
MSAAPHSSLVADSSGLDARVDAAAKLEPCGASAAAPDVARPRWRGLFRRLRFVVSAAAGGALVWLALPTVTGAPWKEVAPAAGHVNPGWLVVLVALWFVGLLAHTITLTAAMPGLTHRRALLLSLTGSAVANVLPVGGAAGIALNYQMAGRWGHTGTSISTYTVVTNVCDVLAKFLLPILALPALVPAASSAGGTVAYAVVIAALVLAVLVGIGMATLASPSAAARAGRVADRLLGRWLASGACRTALVNLQSDTSRVVRTSWRRLSVGMVLHTSLLFVLLLACLSAAGAALSLGAVLAGFAVERLLTLAGLTPGGTGVVEVGLASTLLAFPGAPVGIALGVLLYRAITFGLEIPVGGLALAGWCWTQRRAARTAGATPSAGSAHVPSARHVAGKDRDGRRRSVA